MKALAANPALTNHDASARTVARGCSVERLVSPRRAERRSHILPSRVEVKMSYAFWIGSDAVFFSLISAITEQQ